MQYCRQSFPCCNPDTALLVKPLGYEESCKDFFFVSITSPLPKSEQYCGSSYSSLFPPFACSPQPLVLLIFLTPFIRVKTIDLRKWLLNMMLDCLTCHMDNLFPFFFLVNSPTVLTQMRILILNQKSFTLSSKQF